MLFYQVGELFQGVAVGRAAEGNPFIFREIQTVLAGQNWVPPSPAEREAVLLRHARDLIAFKGEMIGIREMRRHVINYVRGYRGAAALRRQINTITTFDALAEAVTSFFRDAQPAD